MFDIYGNMKEPLVSEPLKVQMTGGKSGGREKSNRNVWECKYHIVRIPKYRRKRLYGQIARYLGEIFHELAGHKESRIVEGHLCPDYVHILIAIPRSTSLSWRWVTSKGKVLQR